MSPPAFLEGPPRPGLTKAHSFHIYWTPTWEPSPVVGARITVVTRIDVVPALRKLTTRERATYLKE